MRVEFELVQSVEVQFSAFESGFKKVCGGDALEVDTCGTPALSLIPRLAF